MRQNSNKVIIILLLLFSFTSCEENIELEGLTDENSSPIADTGSILSAEDICSGKSILGTLGTATCQAVSDFRFHNVGDDSTQRIFPDPDSDATNFTSLQDPSTSTNYILENSIPSSTCGLTGTIANRITDCAINNPTTANWDSAQKSNTNHHSSWHLVSRTASGKLVWQDERTMQIWSDSIVSNNWCIAAGATTTTGCTNGTYESLCGEGSGRISSSLTSEDWGTGIYNDAKGGMGLNSSTGQIKWRLPSQEDFMLAHAAGLHYAYPNAGTSFWTSTPVTNSGYAVYYELENEASYGNAYGVRFQAAGMGSNIQIRCIGEAI